MGNDVQKGLGRTYKKQFQNVEVEANNGLKLKFKGLISSGCLAEVYHVEVCSDELNLRYIPAKEFALKVLKFNDDDDDVRQFKTEFETISKFSQSRKALDHVFADVCSEASEEDEGEIDDVEPSTGSTSGDTPSDTEDEDDKDDKDWRKKHPFPPIIVQTFFEIFEITDLKKKLRLKQDFEGEVFMCYLMELCDFTLDYAIKNLIDKVGFEFKLFYLIELFEAIFFLNGQGIIHRDLHTFNIMFMKRSSLNPFLFQGVGEVGKSFASFTMMFMDSFHKYENGVPINRTVKLEEKDWFYEIRVIDFDLSKDVSRSAGDHVIKKNSLSPSGPRKSFFSDPELFLDTEQEQKDYLQADCWTVGMVALMVMLGIDYQEFDEKFKFDYNDINSLHFALEALSKELWREFENPKGDEGVSKLERCLMRFIENMIVERGRRQNIGYCFLFFKNIFRRVLIEKTLKFGPWSCTAILKRMNQKLGMQSLNNPIPPLGLFDPRVIIGNIFSRFEERRITLFDISESPEISISVHKGGFQCDLLSNLHREIGWTLPFNFSIQNHSFLSLIEGNPECASPFNNSFIIRRMFRVLYSIKFCAFCGKKNPRMRCSRYRFFRYCSVYCLRQNSEKHNILCNGLIKTFKDEKLMFHKVRVSEICSCCGNTTRIPEGFSVPYEDHSLLPCENCKFAFYCSESCREADKIFHESSCGKFWCQEEHYNPPYLPPKGCCSSCGKDDCRFRCSRCKVAYYCGEKCQGRDWKTHKKNCVLF